MVSLTCRPPMPPRAFTSLVHSSYPFSNAWPSAEKFPVRDSDAPMVIRLVELVGEVGRLVELPVLVQAARTLAPSTARALRGKALPENQGRTGLTPSFSFRLGQDWPHPSRRTRLVIPGETASCCVTEANAGVAGRYQPGALRLGPNPRHRSGVADSIMDMPSASVIGLLHPDAMAAAVGRALSGAGGPVRWTWVGRRAE